MASVGNALEGRKLDLTAAKVLKFGLLKMGNALQPGEKSFLDPPLKNDSKHLIIHRFG